MTIHDTIPAHSQRQPEMLTAGGTARLALTMAIADYDHIHDLANGNIQPEGMVLTPFILPVEEIFFRFTKHLEWDISELSFAKYIAMTSHGTAPMVAIPVFPSRVFRHSAIYVRSDSNIDKPSDLNGKRVGIPEWAQTAGVYVRGMLQETYGVDLASIEWIQAGVNQAGREEKVGLTLPSGIRCNSRPDTCLNDMLLAGEVDAIITARPPTAFTQKDSRIRLLFANPREEERRYWNETNIFPIMHAITIRKEVFERHPWVASSLMKAFEEAKKRSLERALDIAVSRFPLPWIAAYSAEIQSSFGTDFWPYGIKPSRPTLEAFCRFAYQQGIAQRLMSPEELFPQEVHASFKV